jgi:peptidoglycan/LPS O-acetylase OafA/YrhL
MSMAAVPPSVSSLIFNGDFAWISGVLGTITQELFFYLISSIVYFTLGSRRFLKVISGISVALYFSLHLKFLDGFLFYEQFKVLARDFGFSLWVYFAFGIFLFYRNGKTIGSRVLWTLSLIIFAISQNMIDLKNRSDFDLAFYYLAALIFIFCIAIFATRANANKSRVLNNRYSKFIGNISYEFYLVHEFVGLTLISYLTQNLDLQIYVFLLLILYVLCLGISMVIYSYWYEPVHGYFEKKFNLLKR